MCGLFTGDCCGERGGDCLEQTEERNDAREA